MAVAFRRVIPVLRIFDVAKAREFYLDFLGFSIDWEHRFEPGMPAYTQVSRDGFVLHVSEHHGDASPGSTVSVDVSGIDELHRELNDKRYTYARPGVRRMPWKARVTEVTDPFGNRIRFSEDAA
jgi:uncharacterized glyoxalase superfamily protein PhnB